jgi:hypothetical protein
MAVIESDFPLSLPQPVSLLDREGNILEAGMLQGTYRQEDWTPYKYLYRVDFSAMRRAGTYRLLLVAGSHMVQSDPFTIGDDTLAELTIPAILHYYRRQRANTPIEWSTDEHIPLFRSTQTTGPTSGTQTSSPGGVGQTAGPAGGAPQTVDMRGGWCDASGDVSKYFSHLAYANVMSPQQTPLVTWSLAESREAVPTLLNRLGVLDSITDEALWGADYMMRALSPQGYFYMIVFSYFNKDPNARRVVGLLANSVTDTNYACAFREGGGMAIAALARISKWKRDGAFTSSQYLEGAERAFAHLLINNTRYDDDGKENIIDDYCALMAATELWIATDSLPGSTLTAIYRQEARRRASSLESRLGPQGYFLTDSTRRPFWHASDAGLPIVALARYLDAETDPSLRGPALQTIRRYLDYLLRVTRNVSNPYGYARQTFRYQGKIMDGFFIPHDNETGWWWQGENARLASLATAALVGGRLVYTAAPGGGSPTAGAADSLAECRAFAQRQLNWILGCNPYSICFMYGFGQHNVPYMQSNFGHGSERGGISNGITGKEGRGDGGGIDFKTQDNGNEWRWTEQWIPHAAWFLQAVTALSQQD